MNDKEEEYFIVSLIDFNMLVTKYGARYVMSEIQQLYPSIYSDIVAACLSTEKEKKLPLLVKRKNINAG